MSEKICRYCRYWRMTNRKRRGLHRAVWMGECRKHEIASAEFYSCAEWACAEWANKE
jgi:hypothetical protein